MSRNKFMEILNEFMHKNFGRNMVEKSWKRSSYHFGNNFFKDLHLFWIPFFTGIFFFYSIN